MDIQLAAHAADHGLDARNRWQIDAACAGQPEPFFQAILPDDRPATSKAATQAIAEAKRICAGCPVAGPCLEFALADDDLDRDGVFGGMTPHERRVEKTRRWMAEMVSA